MTANKKNGGSHNISSPAFDSGNRMKGSLTGLSLSHILRVRKFLVFFICLFVFSVMLCNALYAGGIPKGTSVSTEDAIEIPPYLLSLKTDSAVISWITPIPVAGKILLKSIYGERTFNESPATRYHKVEFQELKPGTLYRYEINDLYEGSFTTSSEHESFRVVALGHTHGTEGATHYPDELFVSRVQELDPDMVLHSGDITYFARPTEFKRYYFDLFQDVLKESPIYVAAGNHDIGWPGVYGLSSDNFRKLLPYDYAENDDVYYSFVYKNAKFIALSYYTLDEKNSRQYKWLRQELKNSTSDFNIIFLGGAQKPRKRIIEDLFEVLGEYRVDLVLGGDGAGPFRQTINGIPFYFSGTSGGRPHTMYLLEFHGKYFVIKQINAQGNKSGDITVINSKNKLKNAMDIINTKRIKVSNKKGSINTRDLNKQRLRLGESIAFSNINISSKHFDGVSLVLRCIGPGNSNLRLFWRSAEIIKERHKHTYGNEGTYKIQHVPLYAGKVNRYLFNLPKRDPLNNTVYELFELRLRNLGNGCSGGFVVEEFSLFKD